MVNIKRLGDTFKQLVGIDSISKEEGNLCSKLKIIFESMGAETIVDDAGKKIGGSTGNLIARFKGNAKAPPLLLNAHMDTVEPGKGITAILKKF